ncbi:helix-turn-helix domain-containing protein [Roseibium sediminicola]|uniref:XRE family transcriptional regulator n=1 Tax=Roseibium sediminicola TaxID=2933272 RepID=A0ABT0GU39_9HYPH|nr:XRE family transcriptional regulator [Roseibium sp. CAU 1639]MCK7612328.1 XRE family transcriptional regulator [Roseibium sp. CAU 1639]
MRMGVFNFQGERLKEARQARGLYKNALAEMAGLSTTIISNYENNTHKPSSDVIDKISSVLNFSENYFLSPAFAEKIENIHWRDLQSETKTAREMTIARCQWACEVFSFICSEVEYSTAKLPDFDLPPDPTNISNDDIERVAVDLRKLWGVGTGPLPDVILGIENLGVPVVSIPLASDKQDGFCFYSNLLKTHFIGINSNTKSACRSRLDAAHELGHAILHKHLPKEKYANRSIHKLVEKQAFRFAGAVLFPERSFYKEVESFSVQEFKSLKKKWGMSIAAMIARSFDLGMIDSQQRSNLYRNMGRLGMRGHDRMEPYDDTMEKEEPRLMRRGIEAMLNSGVFSASAISSSIPIPAHEIEEIANLPKGTLTGQICEPKIELKSVITAKDLESGKVIEFNRYSK